MKLQEFYIVCNGGREKVTGRRQGKYFGIHGERGRWTLTHLPSGYAIAYPFTLDECKRIVKGVMRLSIDWGQSNYDFFQKLPAEVKRQVGTAIRLALLPKRLR